MATKSKTTKTPNTGGAGGDAKDAAVDPFAGDLLACYEFILDKCAENPDLGHVVYVGPPQCGKTRHQRTWAASRKRRVIHANLQGCEPEDMRGLPYRVDRKGKTRAAYTNPPLLPAWFLDKIDDDPNYDGSDVMIQVDELDKPERYKLDSALTFLSPYERRLGDVVIPRKAIICGAMNIPDAPLPEALVARLLFLPFPPTPAVVHNQFKSFRYVAEKLWSTVPEIRFPERPKAPGSGHIVQAWMEHLSMEFWGSETLRRLVVRGAFNDKDAASVLSMLAERPVLPGREWAKAVRPQDVARYFVDIMNALDQEERAEVTTILSTRANEDTTGELGKSLETLLQNADELAKIKAREGAPAAA